jgi:hypothetical protein
MSIAARTNAASASVTFVSCEWRDDAVPEVSCVVSVSRSACNICALRSDGPRAGSRQAKDAPPRRRRQTVDKASGGRAWPSVAAMASPACHGRRRPRPRRCQRPSERSARCPPRCHSRCRRSKRAVGRRGGRSRRRRSGAHAAPSQEWSEACATMRRCLLGDADGRDSSRLSAAAVHCRHRWRARTGRPMPWRLDRGRRLAPLQCLLCALAGR